MNIVLICYNEAIDDEVIELLEDAKAQGYTKWTKFLGKGVSSSPHLLSHIWPKANNVIATVLAEDVADQVFENVRKKRKEYGSEGIKAFMWNVTDVT